MPQNVNRFWYSCNWCKCIENAAITISELRAQIGGLNYFSFLCLQQPPRYTFWAIKRHYKPTRFSTTFPLKMYYGG